MSKKMLVLNLKCFEQLNKLNLKKYLKFTFLAVGVIACQTEQPIPEKKQIIQGPIGQRLDSILTPYIETLREKTDNTAGLAIGVTKGDQIIYAKTFGYADVQARKAASLNTAFHIASVSKPFSAVAIAKLIQDKKMLLDDPIIKYIPEFKMDGEGYDKITIEHILTHTSGIPRNIAPDDWLNPSYGPKALEENLEIVSQHALDFEPGTKYNYSNSAFDILGVVISRASGMSFADYIEKEIFEPVGMTDAALIRQKDESSSNWASSYSYGIETEVWTPYPYNERLFPSSGVVASLMDMCRWGQVHLGKGKLDGQEVLDKEHFNLVVSPKFDTPWNDKIGLSWFLQSYLDRPIIMHTGQDTGFEAMMYIYPEDDLSIIVLANRDFSRTGRIVNAVSEVVFGKEPKSYELSAKYPFAKAYKENGIDAAVAKWEDLKRDTTDIYYTEDGDILTTGAILENAQQWKASQEILEYYLSLNKKSTYAWRLLGNTHLNLGDSLTAKSCYEETLKINPNYEKGRMALEGLEKLLSK